MYKILFLFCVLSAFCGKSQIATSNGNELSTFIKKTGDSLFKSSKLPGLFVGLLNGNDRSYYSFGYAVPDNKTPFDSATVFEAGSITKTFTAFIVESILQEKGMADTTSILLFLPDSIKENRSLAGISFLSLLNHTSGLPRLPDNISLDGLAPYDDYREKDLYAYLKTVQPAPDGKSNYSNLGMGLAGVLAQRMTGKTYSELLAQYIVAPFSMNNTIGKDEQKAQGYFENDKVPFWQMNILFPAGGLYMKANNMLTYLKNMSTPSAAKAKQITDEVLTPTLQISPAMQVAKAWFTLEGKGKPVIYWHNGGTYGFSTFAGFIKGTQQAVIVVANRFDANAITDRLGIAIMRKMLE